MRNSFRFIWGGVTLSKYWKWDYVLYFGRFSEEKGIGTLVKVCKEIRENKIMFDTSLKIGEDTAFVNEYVRKSKKVICLDQKNYVHIVNDQSVMENLYRDNAWKSLYGSICVSKSILKTSKSSKVSKAILAAVVQAEEHLLRIMCVKNVTGEIYDGELKSFKKNYLRVVLDPRIDVKQRIKVLMMGINPFRRKFYERIYRVK